MVYASLANLSLQLEAQLRSRLQWSCRLNSFQLHTPRFFFSLQTCLQPQPAVTQVNIYMYMFFYINNSLFLLLVWVYKDWKAAMVPLGHSHTSHRQQLHHLHPCMEKFPPGLNKTMRSHVQTKSAFDEASMSTCTQIQSRPLFWGRVTLVSQTSSMTIQTADIRHRHVLSCCVRALTRLGTNGKQEKQREWETDWMTVIL